MATEIDKVSENDANSKLIALAFADYAKELQDKQDRYERILKINRDITIESKRIIFLLHTVDAKKNNKEKVLRDADKRLRNLCNDKFKLVAKELANRDSYQYLKAYAGGLQEFVEASSFYDYTNGVQLSDWTLLQIHLTYKESENESLSSTSCHICPTDFILGLADVTGEIMRKCIMSLGSADLEECNKACNVLREFYSGYIGINTKCHRDFRQKLNTLEQNVLKAEKTCYQLKLRTAEATKFNFSPNPKPNSECDEGYCG